MRVAVFAPIFAVGLLATNALAAPASQAAFGDVKALYADLQNGFDTRIAAFKSAGWAAAADLETAALVIADASTPQFAEVYGDHPFNSVNRTRARDLVTARVMGPDDTDAQRDTLAKGDVVVNIYQADDLVDCRAASLNRTAAEAFAAPYGDAVRRNSSSGVITLRLVDIPAGQAPGSETFTTTDMMSVPPEILPDLVDGPLMGVVSLTVTAHPGEPQLYD